jgi:hypothetical protein
VVVVGTTVGENGRHEPLLQGALRKTIPYFMDTVGYLYVSHTPDGGLQRNLLVQPTPTIVAKDGTGQLGGPVIADPNITQLYERLV